MEEKKKKVVVAFTGGLDTSFTVMYLAKEKGYEVYAACANTGGFSAEQLKTNEENAYKLGAVKYVTLDVTQEYYEKSLKYMVFGNVLRNGTYPISVSSERIFQALAIARYANEIGAHAIAHGSTGAGNDQVRFDMTFLVMAPGVEIITLTRDMALSRSVIGPQDTVTVSVTVTNTGKYTGDAVPQLYVRDMFSSVVKPERQLAAFRRLTLAPGESRRVELTVGPKQLRTLGPDYVWRVEPGKFELQLGDNAENILLRADLTVE